MSYQILDSIRNQNEDSLKEQFAVDVLNGFSRSPKFLNSKYFYDDKGSLLFEKITDLEEYYPTKCEFDVFTENKTQIIDSFGEDFNLIELGAGDGRKTRVLLEELIKRNTKFTYKPIDISESAVEKMELNFKESYPELEFSGVVGEYVEALSHLTDNSKRKNVVLFLGSNIGNFDWEGSQVFLRILWKHLNPNDLLLVGFDLKKNIQTLLSAYNDSKGVTSEFNLNILHRINKDLGGEFDVDQFFHFGTYNPLKGAMESFLISKIDQEVYISDLGKKFHFGEYESIHMEYSSKYTTKQIESLGQDTGYKMLKSFMDQKKFFTDTLFEVEKI
ncbi:MAG: L-histidine N(alpha)-methyltransferase [Bdellovibrionales bacterium]